MLGGIVPWWRRSLHSCIPREMREDGFLKAIRGTLVGKLGLSEQVEPEPGQTFCLEMGPKRGPGDH